jgi:hypothetical protein
MSDFESFSGLDTGGEGSDPAAFEKFKERMQAAAAQLKALQAGEQKQRKKEDELIKILLKFIKTGQKRDQLLLVSRLLEQNVPAGFIVSILLISNPEIQQELGIKLLPSGEPVHDAGLGQSSPQKETLPDRYLGDNVLPLAIKIAIDSWIGEIVRRASDDPARILQTILDETGIIKLAVTQLAVFCLRDFLEEQGSPTEYDKLKDFMYLMLEAVVQKLKEQVKEKKQLRGY